MSYMMKERVVAEIARLKKVLNPPNQVNGGREEDLKLIAERLKTEKDVFVRTLLEQRKKMLEKIPAKKTNKKAEEWRTELTTLLSQLEGALKTMETIPSYMKKRERKPRSAAKK